MSVFQMLKMAESGEVEAESESIGSQLIEKDGTVGEIDFSLEELDDVEYDIPPISKPPTLESILNDQCEDDISEDEALSPLHEDSILDPEETVSISSRGSSETRSRGSADKRKKKPNAPRTKSRTIMRHVVLKGISSQILSASDRINAGFPTCLAISHLIAVGTSHGLVLVFVPSQTLKWCLGNISIGSQYGAASSLGFNTDCTRLLVGFAKGQIMMYDLTNGKLLRTITDGHPPATAVLQLKFTDLPTLALCSDSGGSVFELNFKRTVGVRGCESRCLFSGSRGEVCTIEPLLLQQYQMHPLHEFIMVAMATLSKVIVVSIRPRMKVLFTHPLRCDPSTLPVITWQFVIIQVADASRVVDPVLAFARESMIYFFQVTVSPKQKIHFIPLQKLQIPFVILNLQWFNALTLAVFDIHEKLHIFDVRSQGELEEIDLSDVKLVYGSSHFKALATGGNVSKAMVLAGERACYNTVVGSGNHIFVLGTKSLHLLLIRTWEERIDHVLKQKNYLDGMALALDFYEDRGKAVIGLKGTKEEKKKIIKDKLLNILDTFLDHVVMITLSDDNVEDNRDYLMEVVPACVGHCISLDRMDVLFGKACDTFASSTLSHSFYLESLEQYILNDQIKFIPLTIAKEFVTHYEEQENFQALEACIVHLDISSIDIHQVMKISWTYGMYDAIIYIYNRGMKDYTTPIEELIVILQNALSTGKQLSHSQITLGNKLLVYISCCLAGRGYPVGDCPQEEIKKMKYEVFKCITSLHSRDANDSEQAYPYLRTFLHYDSREFFNVLALAFEEPEFTSELGMRQQQRIVDILLQVMVNGDGFSPRQIGALFTFLARQMARQERTIYVDRMLFEQVVEYLTSLGDTSHQEERQQALLDLLEAGDLQHYNEDRLLQLAEKASFHRVCELLYEKRKEYDKIVTCYLQDLGRRPQIFLYLRNLFSSPHKMSAADVEKQILLHIEVLVETDNQKSADIVCSYIPTTIPGIIKKLEDNAQLLYQFLQGLFQCKEAQSSSLHSKGTFTLEPFVHEKYIELMCHFNPYQVHSHIKNYEGYRIEEVLQTCKKFKLIEASAYLLEKSGDVHGAFGLMLEKLQAKVKDTLQQLHAHPTEASAKDLIWTQLNGTVLVLVQLCQRTSGNLNEEERKQLWFKLLEEILILQHDLRVQEQEHFKACHEMTRHILNSMMSYVPLPAIVKMIMMDPSYSGGKLAEIKELLLSMLETYNYEVTLLTTTQRLFHSDLHHQLAQLHHAASQGYAVSRNHCSFCKKTFGVGQEEQLAVFRCRHTYHLSCLQSVTVQKGGKTPSCYICSQHIKNSGVTIEQDKQTVFSQCPVATTLDSYKPVLNPLQNQALESLHKISDILPPVEAHPVHIGVDSDKRGGRSRSESASLFHREDFALKLEPPLQQMDSVCNKF